MNYKKMIPQLVAWTTKPGDDYSELTEVYEEAVGRWAGMMGHVANVIGGVNVDLKTPDIQGAIFRVVPKARQKAALQFLADNAIATQAWLAPNDIISRIGPSSVLAARQAGFIANLLSNARLYRLSEAERFDPVNAYPVTEYMGDLKRVVFNGPSPDANRRQLQRAYLTRLGAIVNPPTAPAAPPGGAPAGAPGRPTPFVTVPPIQSTDLPALARAQLREIQREARTASTTATSAVDRAHWADLVDRITEILDPKA
jgi:hypothetical protein